MPMLPTCTRRAFLRRSASCTPLLVAPTLLGRGGVRPPSDRVAMGFIGLGGQGGGHLFGGAWTYLEGGYLGRPDVQVVAVCDVHAAKREAACERVNAAYAKRTGRSAYAGCTAYRDFRDLIERDDIDAVLMALPIHWHGPMATMAMAAGKDVYCEKPVSLTVRESQQLRATAHRYGCVLQAGTQQRCEYGGKFRRACEYVRSGRIGVLKEIYAVRPGGGFLSRGFVSDAAAETPPPDRFDSQLWAGPAPWMPELGFGAFTFGFGGINWGQHHYDIVQWAAGMDHTGPVELWPEGGSVSYRYPNGVVVHGRPYPGEPVGGSGGATFVGTEGRISVDRDRLVSTPAGLLREPLGPGDIRLESWTSHSGNFLSCVRNRAKTICNADVAMRSIQCVLLGGIAMTLGRSVRWDPERQEFPGDPEANRLCSYAHRPLPPRTQA